MSASRPGAGLRIGLVGCGEVAEHKHLRALARVRGARVVAVADVDAARCRHVADRYAIPLQFPDARSLLAAGVADLVGVLVPPAAHAEVACLAIEAGCHVLVEKPLALSLDDADDIVRAASGRATLAMTGFHMRWHRLLVQARALVRAGRLGAMESIRATWNSPRGDAGIPDWKRRRATGGGALVELAIHIADLWRWLPDTDVTDVLARARHGGRDDENVLLSARLANGALAEASASERTSHDIGVGIAGASARMRIACQRFDGLEVTAVRETDGMPGPRLRAAVRFARELPRGVRRMRSLGDYGDSYRAMWQAFVDAVRIGGPPPCPLDDGREALRVILAAAESEATNRSVAVADAPRTLRAPSVER